MVLKKYIPSLDQKVEYIYYSHPRPWHLNCGNLIRHEIEDGTIYVDFTLSMNDALETEKWDPATDCVILTVLDDDDRVVFETQVPVEKKFIEGRIGLRQ